MCRMMANVLGIAATPQLAFKFMPSSQLAAALLLKHFTVRIPT